MMGELDSGYQNAGEPERSCGTNMENVDDLEESASEGEMYHPSNDDTGERVMLPSHFTQYMPSESSIVTSVKNEAKGKLTNMYVLNEILDVMVNSISKCRGHCTTSGARALLLILLSIMSPVAASLHPPDDKCFPTLLISQDNKHIIDFNLKIGAPMELTCNTASCGTMATIVYEKTVDNGLSWSKAYVNDKTDNAVSIVTEYTIDRNRTEYASLRVHHILVVKLLKVEDQGQWRCAGYDENGNAYKSNKIEIKVHASPVDDSVNIQLANPILVTNETVDVTCHCNNVYPEADIVWRVNNTEYELGQHDNHHNEDGLWSLNNTFKFRSESAGEVNITCAIKAKGTAKTLAKNSITFSVKDAPKVVFPTNDSLIKTTGDSLFMLYCNGSGYRPQIDWLRDGRPINTNDYIIASDCEDQTKTCYSSISPQPHRRQMSYIYTESYSCVVQLRPPYQNTKHAISPEMQVYLWLPLDTQSAREISLLVLVGVTACIVFISIVTYAALQTIKACRRSPSNTVFGPGQAHSYEEASMLNGNSDTVSLEAVVIDSR